MKIAVVGLGYVGVPVMCYFAKKGFDVVGIDIDASKVEKINSGNCPIEGKEPGLKELFHEVYPSGKMRATLDFSEVAGADAVLISVDTPIDQKMAPNYKSLRAAVASVGEHLSKGALVVIESTVAPGTTEKVVRPILEERSGLKAGKDFYLAHCPERLQAGKLLHGLINYDRVVGGVDQESTRRAMELYSKLGKGKLHPTDALTAEVVKTTENAYRDTQIAFANELALLCEKIGIDVFEVQRLVNTCPYRDMHKPGAGVGGHCLPKDPWLLIYGAGNDVNPKIIPTAREINDYMPVHMLELVEEALAEAGKELEGSNVTVLGFTFIENSDDIRNTPALPLIEGLRRKGANVAIHDPFASFIHYEGVTDDFEKAVSGSDCIALITIHDEYRNLDLAKLKKLMRTPVIVDGRNGFNRESVESNGFIYRGIGKGVR